MRSATRLLCDIDIRRRLGAAEGTKSRARSRWHAELRVANHLLRRVRARSSSSHKNETPTSRVGRLNLAGGQENTETASVTFSSRETSGDRQAKQREGRTQDGLRRLRLLRRRLLLGLFIVELALLCLIAATRTGREKRPLAGLCVLSSRLGAKNVVTSAPSSVQCHRDLTIVLLISGSPI